MHLKKENAFLFRQAGNERSQFPQKAQVVTIDCQCVTGYQRTWLCRIEHTPLKICFCLELLRFLVWQAVRPAHQAANMTSLAMGPSTKRECHPIRLRKICQCAMLDVAKYKFPLTCGESIGELDLLYSTDHLTGSNLLIVWILYIYVDILQLKAPEGFHLVDTRLHKALWLVVPFANYCPPPRETPTVMFCFPRRLWLKAAVSWCKGFQSAPFTCTAQWPELCLNPLGVGWVKTFDRWLDIKSTSGPDRFKTKRREQDLKRL
jgi:hypothetical protein